jgi:hypothetical protein
VDAPLLPLAVAWWAPIAIIGGALAGAFVGYLLLLWAGGPSPREATATGKHGYVRAEESSRDVRWNPWAFAVAGALIALVVGLSIGLSLD